MPKAGSVQPTLAVEPLTPSAPRPLAVAALAPEPTPFIGREEECGQLRNFFRLPATEPDRPLSALLQGEAGLGKTRLLEEALKDFPAAMGCVIWTGEVHGNAVTHGPILKWIRTIASILPDMSAEVVDEKISALIGKTPELEATDAFFLQAALGTPAALRRLHCMPEEHVRRNLDRIFGRLLAAQSGTAGLCLIVEHAQWLDRGTGRWLDEALEGLIGVPLAVLALTRDPERGWIPKATPEFTIEPRPLSAQERTLLLAALTPSLDFLPELRRRVIENGGGTPLFMQELSRLMAQVMAENSGPIHPGRVANIVEMIPLSLNELIQRRIERLDERTRRLLNTAVILGMDFSLGLLECFEQIHDNLRDQLAVLESMRLIRQFAGEDGPGYRFVEDHVREIVYDSLLEEQRRQLHFQAARGIERLFSDRLDEYHEVLAFHLARAGQSDKAVDHRIKAIDRQIRLGDIPSALEGYEQAMELTGRSAMTVPLQTRLARLLTNQARLLRFQGRPEEALEALDAALTLARQLGNNFLFFRVYSEQAQIFLWQGCHEKSRELLVKLRQDARELRLPTGECLVLAALGVIDWHEGKFEAALAAFRELAERARVLGLDHLEADALNNTGLIYWRWGQYPEAARAFRATSALRMRQGDHFGLIAALLNLAIIQEQLGEIRPALKNYQAALDAARQTGFVQGQAALEVNLSNLERRTGLVSTALDHAARGLELARRAGDPLAEMAALENLGLAHAALGRRDEADASLSEALELAKRAGAEEKQVQIELDRLEIGSRAGQVDDGRLIRVGELLRRIETQGYHDLRAQASRLKGRLLHLAPQQNPSRALDYLVMSLDYAIQSQNIFEEWESLKELLQWSAADRPVEARKWENRAQRIEKMVRLRGVGD